jgi:hypothetical protein
MHYKRRVMIGQIKWAIKCWVNGALSGKEARRHVISALLSE